jgi:hypothetical protein
MLQYTANLDRKMSINTEISFEPEEHDVSVGIEVLEIAIAPTPAVHIAAGQFHLPLSPWAVTASQGAFRYLPTAVPEALAEEAGEEFLPIDQLGLQLRGQVALGFWQFSYAAAASNGRAPDPGSASQQFDFNNSKALTGRVAIQSPGGFSVGAGGYYDVIDVHDETLLDGTEAEEDEEFAKKTVIDDATETIVGASVGWQGGPVELAAEILPGFRYDLGLRLAYKTQVEIAYELDSQSWGWGVQAQLAAGF